MPTKWALNETKCKGKRVEARESRIQTKWISKCSSPLAVQLKCFQHYGGTICICSAQEKKISYTRSLAHRTCVFYIIHISISIGLIGIYNKEELIVLFAPVCTHNGWERDNANDCEERQRARGRELRADDILWVLRALQAFLWNTSSRKKMMQKKLRKVCTPKKVTTKANRTHTHTQNGQISQLAMRSQNRDQIAWPDTKNCLITKTNESMVFGALLDIDFKHGAICGFFSATGWVSESVSEKRQKTTTKRHTIEQPHRQSIPRCIIDLSPIYSLGQKRLVCQMTQHK